MLPKLLSLFELTPREVLKEMEKKTERGRLIHRSRIRPARDGGAVDHAQAWARLASHARCTPTAQLQIKEVRTGGCRSTQLLSPSG